MKSHFRFTRGQRNGIFLLLAIILMLQCVYVFSDFSTEEVFADRSRVLQFQNEIDSLKRIEAAKSKREIYPFNPNFITDYMGYTLGMSIEEIDRLHKFRATQKWVNTAEDFQKVTKISDSLLNELSPYFKFPDWIINSRSKTDVVYGNQAKTFNQKQDLNKASVNDLQKVNGIGEVLSTRIVKFRNKFQGGFIADIQLQDVYGISPEVMERLLNDFTVKTPRNIEKITLNSAKIDQLVTIQHIDYELAYEIIDQRTLREGFKSLDDLVKVKDFPAHKIEIIKLYLTLD